MLWESSDHPPPPPPVDKGRQGQPFLLALSRFIHKSLIHLTSAAEDLFRLDLRRHTLMKTPVGVPPHFPLAPW